MTSQLELAARTAFAQVLNAWRTRRGLSKKQLAASMGYHPSYISHVESLRHHATFEFAGRAEAVLASGGEIIARYEQCRQAAGEPAPAPTVRSDYEASPMLPATLVIEEENATLSYAEGWYFARVDRVVRNVGDRPVTCYPVRVDVDRFPDQPGVSRRLYAESPLQLSDLDFEASAGDERPEPMEVRVTRSSDAYLKMILVFGNTRARFPLYPGERTRVTYSYRVPASLWGQWFQRDIRFPTRALTMSLRLPASLAGEVSAEILSYAGIKGFSPTESLGENGTVVYTLRLRELLLTSQVRLRWRFAELAPTGVTDRAA
ncbi:helix-turn-helix domain-containing protein [Actinoplanes solisilvae]|uniref:helix-turn-helix domain-containing protein n=1 Tax=Actinoplanes solisilvae TaxID=2486853 RepID=UPI000FDC0A74|nr:helix-turn-helix transcriptional regulator [Actinoplanes solisilvae]